MPIFRYQEYQKPVRDHIRDPYFKSAIFWASKSLFNALEKCNFDYRLLSEKQIVSLRMYLNRMCFRPTPFGLFSGFSFISWGKVKSCPLSFGEPKIHFNIGYEYSILIAKRLIEEFKGLSQLYLLNPSLYKIGNEYRYIRCHYNENGKQNEFTVDCIQIDEAIRDVLSFCRNKRTGNDILYYIQETFKISFSEANEYFNEILERQAILPDLLPNITGEDYLKRILNEVSRQDMTKKSPAFINEICSETIPNTDDILRLSIEMDSKITGYFEATIEQKTSGYLNLEMPAISGALAPDFQQKIKEGLYCINCLLPEFENNYLSKFFSEFNMKFDQRWVPLMTALDPEIGIEMGSFSTAPSALSLISRLGFDNHPIKSTQIEWTQTHSLLLDKWNKLKRSKNKSFTIVIEDSDLQKLMTNQSGSHPSSISVVFRTVNEFVFIEEAGGVTASALSARFSQFNPKLKQSLSDLVKIEEKSNPDVIFAEIVHNCDSHVANVERRPTFREYEIPIFSSSTLPEERQISLNDLWVSVRNNEILLWSKRLRKRIIPRLTSALNFEKSELPVFRFLCELQHQHLRSSFHFELSHFFPDLSFYPRVQYKNSILSLSSWHFDKNFIDKFFKQHKGYSLMEIMKELAIDLNWPRYISINRYDNYLVFDTYNDDDLIFLEQMLRKEDKITIKEFPFTNQVHKVSKHPYCERIKQYFTYLYHHEKIYEPISPELHGQVVKPVVRKFPPGSTWSYFKVYCHPAGANSLLLAHIIPLCNRWLGSGFLNQWFFVRYKDPEFHLRIRFNTDPIHSGLIIRSLNKCLSPLIEIGFIADFQLVTYEREIERYDTEIMDQLESCFCASTMLITKFLENASNSIQPIVFFEIAYCSVDVLLDVFSNDLMGKIEFLGILYKNMELEFDISKQNRDQLRRRFREIRNGGRSEIMGEIIEKYKIEHEFNIFRYLHKQVFAICKNWPPLKRDELVADLIHMHLNRLFPDSPRKNELIVYYCLWRHYQSHLGRLQHDLLSSFANN